MNLERQKAISRYFDDLHRNSLKPWKDRGDLPLYNKFLELTGKGVGVRNLLDLGCGDGWLSLLTAKRGFTVTGIDSSPVAVLQAKEEAKRTGQTKHVTFHLGNALSLPYSTKSFDGIIDRGLFHHILPDNRDPYLSNILKVLKTEAHIYLSVFSIFNPPDIGQPFIREDIVRIFSRNFSIEEFRQDRYPSKTSAHLLYFILKRKSC